MTVCFLICFSWKMGKKSRVKTQKSSTGATATVSPKEMLNLSNELLQSKSCFYASLGKGMVCKPLKNIFLLRPMSCIFSLSGQACYFIVCKIVTLRYMLNYLLIYAIIAYLYVDLLDRPYLWQHLAFHLNTSINTG